MQYLYLIRPTRPDMLRTGPSDAEASAMAEHFAYLQAALADGRLILAGRTLDPDGFGIAIYNADDEVSAQAFAAADPAVRYGVVTAEVRPYRVALIAQDNVREAA
ncbi:YciI family protein [Chitinimonas koreensis]|uniref:YciI family protein n=1 Tax=Chitinimonas koreensis TaxID=356302 RepID=UPI0004169162|nr:YciI family protein [Chitinimonas koreensis]QNM97046.1 hypothetical protein H9L41_01530 [Chitinimonas koreensis]